MKPYEELITIADFTSKDGKITNDKTKVVIKVKGLTGEELFDILDQKYLVHFDKSNKKMILLNFHVCITQ